MRNHGLVFFLGYIHGGVPRHDVNCQGWSRKWGAAAVNLHLSGLCLFQEEKGCSGCFLLQLEQSDDIPQQPDGGLQGVTTDV